MREESHPHRVSLHFNGLQLEHQSVQRGGAGKQLFELEVDSPDSAAYPQCAIRLGCSGVRSSARADRSDLGHQKPGWSFVPHSGHGGGSLQLPPAAHPGPFEGRPPAEPARSGRPGRPATPIARVATGPAWQARRRPGRRRPHPGSQPAGPRNCVKRRPRRRPPSPVPEAPGPAMVPPRHLPSRWSSCWPFGRPSLVPGTDG